MFAKCLITIKEVKINFICYFKGLGLSSFGEDF